LRLGIKYSVSQKAERVKQIEDLLDLTACKDTKIGNEWIRGVSGGQRKRVSIGIEMIKNPTILALDEPTSGLDSYTSYKIIKTLKNICHEQNRTIFCTIHQPSSELFYLFDDVVFLTAGELIYYGPVSKLGSYMKQIG
jgi:ABC-type multidrug transport system ATPase subunit